MHVRLSPVAKVDERSDHGLVGREGRLREPTAIDVTEEIVLGPHGAVEEGLIQTRLDADLGRAVLDDEGGKHERGEHVANAHVTLLAEGRPTPATLSGPVRSGNHFQLPDGRVAFRTLQSIRIKVTAPIRQHPAGEMGAEEAPEGSPPPSPAFRRVDIERVGRAARHIVRDRAACEEPLEVRLDDEPFAVIMRTPGTDRELVAGFLFAEQVIRSADDLAAIDILPASTGVAGTVAHVRTTAGRAAEGVAARRRQVAQTSSCGMCGRPTIESIGANLPPIRTEWVVTPEAVFALPERLRATQKVFDETGGLHAAGLFDLDGALVESREDVGRHNAVDKVVGGLLLERRLPLSTHVLFVSGRTSFEIVQKAHLAGIPLVASVSAPSTLAIDLAAEAGITLVGFVRGETFNVYTHGSRVGGAGAA